MTRAHLGLGANLGEPATTIRAAARELEAYGTVAARSSLYRTRPWGVSDQPAFVNAALALDTELAPYELLAALKALERELGRAPTFRWGPRAIDLDILTYGALQLDDPDLTLPHAHLHERAFVLVPLAEIEPAFAALRDALPGPELADVQRIGPFEGEG